MIYASGQKLVLVISVLAVRLLYECEKNTWTILTLKNILLCLFIAAVHLKNVLMFLAPRKRLIRVLKFTINPVFFMAYLGDLNMLCESSKFLNVSDAQVVIVFYEGIP